MAAHPVLLWTWCSKLDTNVEFYTALLLHGLGLPSELFTPTFAVGRVLGWSAHCLEHLGDGRLIRPQSAYIGPRNLPYDRGPHARQSENGSAGAQASNYSAGGSVSQAR